MFTELSLGCWSSGHRNLYMYQVLSSTVFFFVSYMHIHIPFIMSCLRLFVVIFQEMNCVHTFNVTLFGRSQSFISPPSFVFVSAAVSETRELNENRKEEEKNNSEICSFFNTFPGHIIYLTRGVPFEHMCAFSLLEVPYTTT